MSNIHVVVLDGDGKAIPINPRVQAMLEMAVESQDDIAELQYGEFEFHFNGNVVHANLRVKTGKRKLKRDVKQNGS